MGRWHRNLLVAIRRKNRGTRNTKREKSTAINQGTESTLTRKNTSLSKKGGKVPYAAHV